MAGAGRPNPIASLPDPLLLAIFQHLPFWTRRVCVPLVCKAWSQLCSSPELWESVLLDFPTECLPATGVYPEHEDQPYVDITAVGRWVARRLPRLRQLRFECHHSRTFNNPSFEENVAMEITSQDFAALLGVMAPRLVSLRMEACDDMLDGSTLGALWCLSRLTSLALLDIGYAIDVRRFNAGVRHLSQLQFLEVRCHAAEHGWGLEAFPLVLPPVLRTLRLVNQRDVEALPPDISRLSSLQELVLRDCGLQGLPPSMSRLSSLTNLAIEGVRPLGAISLEMGDWLGALSALRTLSLRRSLLGGCPPEVGLLRSLRRLDLSSNMLGALPDQLSRLSGLQELNLANNDLQRCPPVLRTLSKSLCHLDCYANRLGTGPADAQLVPLPSLTWLDLSRNRLATPPAALALCTSLAHVFLGGNSLAGLPQELSSLRGLEKLDLRKNLLQQVPAVLGTLPYLRTLILDGNPLRLDQAGTDVLLGIPRLWKLSARVRPPPAPPSERTPAPAAAAAAAPTGEAGGHMNGAAGRRPGVDKGMELGGELTAAGTAGTVGPGQRSQEVTARPQQQQQQQQQQGWVQLAERLAQRHGRTVLQC